MMIQASGMCIGAEHGVDDEEQRHDRAEERRHPRRPAALDGEQRDENDHRRRQDERRELGVDLLEPLQRRKHRYGGGDDRVAAEQRRAGHAEHQGDRRALAERHLRQRIQRQDAAFALVVRLHQEQHVFGRHDDQQRPDDQRHDADDLADAEAVALEILERGSQRIERAGADVAEHDADGAERQQPEIAGGVRRPAHAVAVVRGREAGGREILRHESSETKAARRSRRSGDGRFYTASPSAREGRPRFVPARRLDGSPLRRPPPGRGLRSARATRPPARDWADGRRRR